MERHHVNNLTISKRGLQLIKKFEGLRLVAYKDGGGVWTVGYGHTSNVLAGMQITEAQAEGFLRLDIHGAEYAIRRHVEVPLSQNEYDALVSFVFNVGATQFATSTLLSLLNDLDYNDAAEQLPRWCHDNGIVVQGLLNRRRDERLMFLGYGGL